MANWFITGVSTGLGKALGTAALARGDTVFGSVRKAGDAETFTALAPGRAHGVVVDLRDTASLTEAIAKADIACGGLDILVNNAGYGVVGAVEETSLDEARALFEVNVFGALAAIQGVLPFMRARRRGRIINVTSVSGLATWNGTGLYCASKHALEAIGETLAQEVAELGIHVTNVAPGGMRTDYAGRSLVQTAKVIDDYEGAGHAARRIMAEHAGHEPGDPARMAAAILKLADMEAPPMHLLLGADALKYATYKLEALGKDIADWRELTCSTDFPAE